MALTMPLAAISHPVEADLHAVNDLIVHSLGSQVDTIEHIGHHLIQSGGKRIRPLVVLLSSRACGVQGSPHIDMATIIEFIHTATLLHDDVVDASQLRRGRPTVNHLWDSPSAILVGDFLYSRAFQMMVSLDSMPCMRILAHATNIIAQGEVLQLSHRHQPDIDEQRYLKVITLKTAKLFEAGAQLGAILTQQPSHVEFALAQFGMHLGIAFQLMDDLLDYQADNAEWGKQLGNDLAEGKMTLPLIYALKNASPSQAQHIRDAIEKGDIHHFGFIQEAIISSGAMDYTTQLAEHEVEKAIEHLAVLPDSIYLDAMVNLAQFAVSRKN